jgi:hypothetical protein
MQWQVFTEQTSFGEIIKLQDLEVTNAARFYRLRLP